MTDFPDRLPDSPPSPDAAAASEATSPPPPVTSTDPESPAPPEADGVPAAAPTADRPSPVDAIQAQVLKASVIEILRTVYDPEIPVNIYELGLIYDVSVTPGGRVDVQMTLTSPMCPVAGTLPGEVETKVRGVDGATHAAVELVWEPPWTPERMSEAAKLQLNM